MKFQDLILKPAILKAIDELGFKNPTEIQEHAIPALLKSDNCHLLAQAKTGTGKTVAYAIPIAERINPENRKIQAIIMVPTRELCLQVYEVITNLTKYCDITAVAVYGGVSIKKQIDTIRAGAQILIATPGRLIDLYKRRQVSLRNVRFVILDEADRMLDMGFLPDIEYLMFEAMQGISPRLLLFSATLKGQLSQMAEKFIGDKPKLDIDVSHDTLTVENCHQQYYLVKNNETKFDALEKIFAKNPPNRVLIFVNTRRNSKKLLKQLRTINNFGIQWDMIQGDMSQNQREIVLKKFRDHILNGIVATDVAARGLDIEGITHVINFDLPAFEENYVHRIGRTSRMDKQGIAISLCLTNQRDLIPKIEKFTNTKIERIMIGEEKSKDPEIETLLDTMLMKEKLPPKSKHRHQSRSHIEHKKERSREFHQKYNKNDRENQSNQTSDHSRHFERRSHTSKGIQTRLDRQSSQTDRQISQSDERSQPVANFKRDYHPPQKESSKNRINTHEHKNAPKFKHKSTDKPFQSANKPNRSYRTSVHKDKTPWKKRTNQNSNKTHQ